MSDRTVRIGLIQTPVSGDPSRNLAETLQLAESAILQGAKIVCLQELYRLPYFPQALCCDAARYAETIPGESTEAFSALAKEHGVVIIVPLYERTASGEYHNAVAVIDTDGSLLPTYHKVHIPCDPLFWEKHYFREGSGYRVYDTAFGRFAVLICYDQWFPEAARAVALEGAEIIFYPTAIGWIAGEEEPAEGNWLDAWITVQRSHAIVNGLHVAAVNRAGREGELQFWGSSFVCDSFGTVLAGAGSREQAVLLADVDFGRNRQVREGWGFLQNRRPETYGILAERRFTGKDTPIRRGYRMPAEWERHDAVWLAWPHDPLTFLDIPAVERCYAAIIRALSADETVNLLVLDGPMERRVRELTADARIVFHRTEYADVWFRDYGPTFVVNRCEGTLAMVDWTFNAWGGKYTELQKDDRIPAFLNQGLHLPAFRPGIVLEGGSIEVNGRGTVLTTEQCLLNRNRNPSLSRSDIEEYLKEYLGATHIVWLKEGIAGDDTDGHIDDIARFVDPQTILCALPESEEDENYAVLAENYRMLQEARDQDGNPFRVIPLPMPGRVGDEEPLPASYANFYIGNKTVLVPVFRDPNDERALAIIREAFPERRVIGIDCRAMVEGLGTIHCISQQQPSV